MKSKSSKITPILNCCDVLSRGKIEPSFILSSLSSFLRLYFENKQYRELLVNPNEIVGAATLSLLTRDALFQEDKFKYFWIQKCHRPSDLRKCSLGINFWSRSSLHTQFQIIGRPNWNIAQMKEEAYKIVSWLGLDPTLLNSCRDNWSSPVILAYGTGFELRYKGIEIMQATIFDSYGGEKLNSQVHELVIGLERLAFCLLQERGIKSSMIHYPYQDRYYFKIVKRKDLFFWRSLIVNFLRLCLTEPSWEKITVLSHRLNIINLHPLFDGIDRLYLLKKVQRLCLKLKELEG